MRKFSEQATDHLGSDIGNATIYGKPPRITLFEQLARNEYAQKAAKDKAAADARKKHDEELEKLMTADYENAKLNDQDNLDNMVSSFQDHAAKLYQDPNFSIHSNSPEAKALRDEQIAIKGYAQKSLNHETAYKELESEIQAGKQKYFDPKAQRFILNEATFGRDGQVINAENRDLSKVDIYSPTAFDADKYLREEVKAIKDPEKQVNSELFNGKYGQMIRKHTTTGTFMKPELDAEGNPIMINGEPKLVPGISDQAVEAFSEGNQYYKEKTKRVILEELGFDGDVENDEEIYNFMQEKSPEKSLGSMIFDRTKEKLEKMNRITNETTVTNGQRPHAPRDKFGGGFDYKTRFNERVELLKRNANGDKDAMGDIEKAFLKSREIETYKIADDGVIEIQFANGDEKQYNPNDDEYIALTNRVLDENSTAKQKMDPIEIHNAIANTPTYNVDGKATFETQRFDGEGYDAATDSNLELKPTQLRDVKKSVEKVMTKGSFKTQKTSGENDLIKDKTLYWDGKEIESIDNNFKFIGDNEIIITHKDGSKSKVPSNEENWTKLFASEFKKNPVKSKSKGKYKYGDKEYSLEDLKKHYGEDFDPSEYPEFQLID